MSSGDLKEEYRRLQEQQKRKLERVKELRQAKQQQQQQQQQALTFGINDDLGLHTAAPDPHPPEAGQVEAELRDQLRGLNDENARLKKLVQERDFELAQARKKLAQRQKPSMEDAPGLVGGGGEGAAAVKVSSVHAEMIVSLGLKASDEEYCFNAHHIVISTVRNEPTQLFWCIALRSIRQLLLKGVSNFAYDLSKVIPLLLLIDHFLLHSVLNMLKH